MGFDYFYGILQADLPLFYKIYISLLGLFEVPFVCIIGSITALMVFKNTFKGPKIVI